jgi:hypothetical protein
LFGPVLGSLNSGQDTAILFLGLVLMLTGTLKGQDNLAGIGLALTSIRPQVTLMLLIPFLVNRRNVILWFALWAALIGMLSLLIVGPEGISGFINLLFLSGNGEGFHTAEYAMVNLIGFLYRATGLGLPTIRIIGWAAYLGSMLFLVIWGWRLGRVSLAQIALATILAILASPHLHYHDLATLLIPIVILMLILHEKQLMSPANILVLPLALAWVVMLSNLVSVAVRFSFPAFLMVALAVWILFPEKIGGWFERTKKEPA